MENLRPDKRQSPLALNQRGRSIQKFLVQHVTILPMYSAQLLDHFEHPRNPGEVANPDVTVQIENPACGDILKLSLSIKEGRIGEIRFLAKGCVPAMACGSALTELVRGRTPEEAHRLRREEIVQAVGGLPEASEHASHLAMDALAGALKQIATPDGFGPKAIP